MQFLKAEQVKRFGYAKTESFVILNTVIRVGFIEKVTRANT